MLVIVLIGVIVLLGLSQLPYVSYSYSRLVIYILGQLLLFQISHSSSLGQSKFFQVSYSFSRLVIVLLGQSSSYRLVIVLGQSQFQVSQSSSKLVIVLLNESCSSAESYTINFLYSNCTLRKSCSLEAVKNQYYKKKESKVCFNQNHRTYSCIVIQFFYVRQSLNAKKSD